MTVDLTAEEMELILLSLKESRESRKSGGLPREDVDRLIARLEVVERENRDAPTRLA